MSSPFSVFRKHQKVLMAGTVIMAMVSFIVLGTADQFIQSGSRTDPEAESVIAKWNGGEFTRADLRRLVYNRVALNQFIIGVRRIAAQNLGDSNFDGRPMFSTDNERDIVIASLLAEEAKKNGIVVTDDQVMRQIKYMTGDVVTDSQLNTVLREISSRENPVTFPQLIEAYRHELLAGQARILYGSPSRQLDNYASPAQRWDYFCRLYRRVKLQLYAFPVDQYLSDVRIQDPDDSVLRKFYDEHKDTVQSPSSPEPGFRDPPGVKLEYLKADYLKFFNDAKSKITDEEIRQDFEKNKKIFRDVLEISEGMDRLDDALADLKEEEKKDDGKPVVKATEPDPSAYEEAVGKFAKRAPKASEPKFTDDEVLSRNREAIVKRIAEERARENMSKMLEDVQKKMDRFSGGAYRKWMLANTAEKEEGEETSETSPPKFDLAALANPEAGLTYHQTTMMSYEELAFDKYFRETFVDRRWKKEQNPRTEIEELQIDNPGVALPNYVFQNKSKMNPFRAEDEIAGSAEGLYRNQYVFWKTETRKEQTPAFEDIKDRVKRAWKVANSTGKSARDLAKESAKRLADEINANKTTLKERFGDSADVKETDEFTWYQNIELPTGEGSLPSLRFFPRQTRLEEVDMGEFRFLREVFRLSNKQAGVAMNDSGSIVYVVQVFDAADSSNDTLRSQFLRSPFSRYLQGLSGRNPNIPDEQGYVIASYNDMEYRSFDWYRQLERDYGVEWQERETEEN
jgi:hypothetical protein